MDDWNKLGEGGDDLSLGDGGGKIRAASAKKQTYFSFDEMNRGEESPPAPGVPNPANDPAVGGNLCHTSQWRGQHKKTPLQFEPDVARQPRGQQMQAPTPNGNGNSGIAAAIDALRSQVYDDAFITHELAWQSDCKNDATNQKAFCDDVLAFQGIWGFTMMMSGNIKIHLVDSMHTFSNFAHVGNLNSRAIAFFCDRTQFRSPMAVGMPVQKAWEWKTSNIVRDAVKLKAQRRRNIHKKI
mmetsp:Transcript_26699/g.56408  ORF Transcript_26699/g.56408 Transcript_26699/m.56408 type:complete len:240 (-) Transcript_26699:1152-1871(-)